MQQHEFVFARRPSKERIEKPINDMLAAQVADGKCIDQYPHRVNPSSAQSQRVCVLASSGLIGDEPREGGTDAFSKVRFVPPTQGMNPRDVEELSRRPVGLCPVKVHRTRGMDDVTDNARKLSD